MPSKAGMKSTAEKLAASRPEFGAKPGGDHPVAGAHGDPGKGKQGSANRLDDQSPEPAEHEEQSDD